MSSPSPEEVIQLAKQIVDTKAALAILQSKWDSYFASSPQHDGLFPNVQVPPIEPRKGGRKPDASSVTGRVLSLINSDPQAHFDASDVQRALGIDKKQAERTLFKLYGAKKIAKFSRGNYEAIA